MRFTGVAGRLAHVDDGGLADRQPSARPAAYDPTLVRRSGVAASKLPPLVASGSVIGPVQPIRRRASWASPPRAQVVTGLPDLHGTTRRLRLRARPTRPTSRSVRRPGSAARCPRRRPTSSASWRPSRDSARWAARRTCWATTRRAPAAVCSGSGTPWPAATGPTPVVRRDHRAGRRPPRAGAGGVLFTPVARRRAEPGRRPVGARRLPQRLGDHVDRRPGPGRARGRRLQRPVAARRGRALRRASARARFASSGAAHSRSCGAGSWPTSVTGPWSGWPIRC